MELKSSIEQLTSEDIDILKNRYEKPNLKLAVFVILFMAGASYVTYSMNSLIPIISTIFFFGILAAFYIWVQSKSKKQISSGKKNVYTGIVESRREADYGMEGSENFSPSSHIFCFFAVSGREFMIPAEFYDKFNEGDHVTLHTTIPDDLVFKVI